MDDMPGVILRLALLCAAMGIGMYLMYRNGWMILNAKSAAAFISSRSGKSASFTRCSGSIRKIVRFSEDRSYTFTLDSGLTAGSMSVSLLGPGKAELLHLNSAQPRASVQLEKGTRYTLVLRFQGATGRYGLQWS